MSDPDALIARAEAGVRQAEQGGADAAEVYLWQARGERVMKGRDFQMTSESDRSGVSVRLIRDNRIASATTDGIAETDLAWTIEHALGAVDHVPKSPAFDRFPAPDGTPGSPTEVHPEIKQPDIDRTVGIADQVRDQILEASGIDYFEVIFGSAYGTFALANSSGVTMWDHNGYEQCNLEVRFAHDREHHYTRCAVYGREPLSYEPRLRREIEGSIERVQSTGDSGTLDRAATTALFDQAATNTLLSKIMPAATGMAAHKDFSPFADKLGEPVAVDALTVVDEPRNGEGMRQQRTDDEGVLTRRTPIIEEGVLQNYLYDWSAALETGNPPSGHGLRSGNRHESGPSPSPANLEVAPGTWTREEMIEDIDRGVLVHGPFLGSFTSDPMTGDFSLVAALTFLVEDGEIQHAVPSTTVTGNFFEVLENIRGIGAEPKRLANGRFSDLLVEEVNCVA